MIIFEQTFFRWVGRVLAVAVVTIALTACGGEDSQETASHAPSTSSQTNPESNAREAESESQAPTGNASPSLSGSPVTSLNAGANYSFQPSASDPDGDALSFTVQNLPAWATFDSSTGRISGTPTAAQVGQYADVRISASDGEQSASLPAFSITVTQSSNGSASLSWTPPTQNTDGTALTNLAGYRILYGTDSRALAHSVKITNPSVSTYVVENLSPATWYFVVKAYTASGSESDASNLASKKIL
jgi:hypothetical protein